MYSCVPKVSETSTIWYAHCCQGFTEKIPLTRTEILVCVRNDWPSEKCLYHRGRKSCVSRLGRIPDQIKVKNTLCIIFFRTRWEMHFWVTDLCLKGLTSSQVVTGIQNQQIILPVSRIAVLGVVRNCAYPSDWRSIVYILRWISLVSDTNLSHQRNN